MKHAISFTSIVWASALLLACGADDSDPPPIAAAPPASGAPSQPGTPTTTPVDGTPTTPVMGTTPTGATPTGSEGQGGTSFMGGTPAQEPGSGEAPAGMAAAGTAPTGAAGAAGEMPAPPAELTLPELVGGLDGHLLVVPCADQPQSDDCNGDGWRSTFLDPGTVHPCVTTGAQSRLEALIDFPIGGEPGVAYDVAMHFYGIMEPRQYANVTRDAAPGAPSYEEGGTPSGFATLNPGATNYLSGDNNYNTYELRVLNETGAEVAAYFLNADTRDGHYTFAVNYGKTIQLIGGGTLRMQIVDANCRQIKNCGTSGSNAGAECAQRARTIDISEADPQPAPNLLQQPALGVSPAHAGQWFLLDVVDFSVAQ